MSHSLPAPDTVHLHQFLSHPPLQPFQRSDRHTQDFWYTMNMYPATFHGRVADQRKSPLSHVMGPKSSRPMSSRPMESSLKTSSPEELSLTGILGQIRIKYRKDLWERKSPQSYRRRCGGIWKSWCREVSCPITDAFRQWLTRTLQSLILKMENNEKWWLHHCICKIEEIVNHLEYQTALEKPAAIIQERGVSAKRTQADRRECLMSNSSQETRASAKLAAMFFTRKRRSGKPIQKFCLQARWPVKSEEIPSWRQ